MNLKTPYARRAWSRLNDPLLKKQGVREVAVAAIRKCEELQLELDHRAEGSGWTAGPDVVRPVEPSKPATRRDYIDVQRNRAANREE